MPSDTSSAVSFATYKVTGEGGVQQLSELPEGHPTDETAYQWIRIVQHRTTDDYEFLDGLGLPQIVVQALLAPETQPRFSKLNRGFLLVLRGVNTLARTDPEDMVSVRLWVEPKRVVSVQLRPVLSLEELAEECEGGTAPPTIGQFLTELVRSMTAKIESMVMNLADELDDLEENSLDNGLAADRVLLSELKRQLIGVRRYVAPQRGALDRVSQAETPFLKEPDRQAIRENCDQMVRLVDELDAARERATVISETWTAARAEQMNRNMLVLSIVAAVFLPLGFLTGLLGVNVGGVPGAGSPYGFWIVCGVSVGLAACFWALFKWLKWI